MPEIIEVEYYRRAAEATVGRRIVGVDAPDDWFLKGGVSGADLATALVGGTVVAVWRHGKLLGLVVDAGDGDGSGRVDLGLRFGMTGRLVVDGDAPIDELLYTTTRDDPAHHRFGLRFDGGASLEIVDPRRLGGVELPADRSRLGPDAASLSAGELAGALEGSTAALKARLLDQSRVAGLGNLLCDEILWRVGLAPGREAGGLSDHETAALAAGVMTTIAELAARGGSHTGDLQESRRPGALCPRDGEPMARDRIGGRTTYWCPVHQR